MSLDAIWGISNSDITEKLAEFQNDLLKHWPDITEDWVAKLTFIHLFIDLNPFIPQNHKEISQKQLLLLTENILEILFGGAAGGGKSDGLLMAALMFVCYPNYHAIMFRQTYTDLALPDSLMDRADKWLRNTDAHWDDKTKTWVFPSGATLTFAYLQGPRDKYRYQGAAFHFCLEENEHVITPLCHKCIKDLTALDIVKTINGYSRVSNVYHVGEKECVRVDVIDESGAVISSQVQSIDHRILLTSGWSSYVDILCESYSSIGCYYPRSIVSHIEKIYRSFVETLGIPQLYQMRICELTHLFQVILQQQFGVLSKDDQSYFSGFGDEHRENQQPLSWFDLSALVSHLILLCYDAAVLSNRCGITDKREIMHRSITHALSQIDGMTPIHLLRFFGYLQPKMVISLTGYIWNLEECVNTAYEVLLQISQEYLQPLYVNDCVLLQRQHQLESCTCNDASYVHQQTSPVDSQLNCQSLHDLYDEQPRPVISISRDGAPLQDGVVGHTHSKSADVLVDIPKYNRVYLKSYAHPYTKEMTHSGALVSVYSIKITPIGKRHCCDITVHDDNLYVSSSNIINANCAFDELTQFKEQDYLFLFSRLRKSVNDPIPLRMRSASNPGGVGHDWVKSRFIEAEGSDITFIKSLLTDNPFLDQEAYRQSLAKLDPVTRRQMEEGDWDIGLEGEMFKRHWFPLVSVVDARYTKHRVRFWDLASTAPGDTTKDPDFCASCLMGMAAIDDYCISDITNVRYNESETEAFIASVVHSDGPGVIQVFEREGGSDGKLLHEAWKKTILKGVISEFIPSQHSKIIRAKLPSAAAERGEIKLLEAEWNKMLLDQLTKFPNVLHDDMTDCVSGSFSYLQRYVSTVKNSDLPKRGAIIGRINATGTPVISQRDGFNSW